MLIYLKFSDKCSISTDEKIYPGEDIPKAPVKPNTPAPKETAPTSSSVTQNTPSTETPLTVTQTPLTAPPRKVTSPKPKDIHNPKETPMDTSQNLKR